MKQVISSPAVELSIRSLDPDSVRRVHDWFDYLRRWDEDEAVRNNSLPLPGHPDVFVLRTTTDIRVFFRIEGDVITILDVAKKRAILTSGGISVNSPADLSLVPTDKKGR